MRTTTTHLNALLVDLGIHLWGVEKGDKRGSEAVCARFGVGKDFSKFKKRLIDDKGLFAKVKAAAGALRQEHYKRTLPWGDKTRILSCDGYIAYCEKMTLLKDDFGAAVDDFVMDFQVQKDRARVGLGALFNENDYPSNVRESFGVTMDFLPLPTGDDFRVNLGVAEREKLAEELEKKSEERIGSIITDVFKRAFVVLEKAANTLSDKDAIFRDSLIQNVMELIGIMDDLNITGDPKITALRKDMESVFYHVVPQTLRDDEGYRAEKTKEINGILDTVRGYI